MCDFKNSLRGYNKKISERGFTLLEILASLFIFAILTIGIASTMKQTTTLAKRVKSREAKTMSAMIALDRLERDIQMAYNGPLRGEHTVFKLIEGTMGSELVFRLIDSPMKTLVLKRTPGLIFASYKLEKEENGTYKLLRSEVPFYSYDKMSEASPQILASGLLQFKIEGYDSLNDRWLKEWDDRGPATGGYIPKAVRITLESIDPDIPKDQWKDKSFKLETEFMVLNELESAK
jgi:prepilin-type N-terminal cleavage/methylation domain-containing protein